MRLLFLAAASRLFAGEPGGVVFDESRVAQIQITISPENYAAMLKPDAPGYHANYPYVPAAFTFDGVTLTNVAARIKGHGGTFTPSFKIDFNRYQKELKLDGLKKLNLNFPDGQIALSEYLGYGVFREFGIAAARTGWADVTVNGKFAGLCVLVEQHDQDFIDRNFEFRQGNLYKPEPPAGILAWRGPDIDNYAHLSPELQDGSNHASLLRFLDAINNGPVANIHQTLDVRGFLAYLAGNAAMRNWDAFSEMGHNYLLYENTPGRFTFLPWDMEHAMDGLGLTATAAALFPSATSAWPGEKVKLTSLILAQPQFRAAYLEMLRVFLAGPASSARLRQRVEAASLALTNRLKSLDLDFPHLSFANSLHARLERDFGSGQAPRVLLNEVVASNQRDARDEHGEADDWIELRNPGGQDFDLSGCFLTDDPAQLRKWQFPPNTILPAQGFLMVWADGQPHQGPLHASFKLDAAGEELILSERDENANGMLDRLRFPALASGAAFGRLASRPAALISLQPTFFAPNIPVDSDADGLPDSWEAQHGLSALVANGALDADGDGLSNFQELLAGGDPRDANSPPRLRVVRNPGQIHFSWGQSEPRYWIERSTNLKTWTVISAAGPVSSHTGATALEKSMFYRLRRVE